MNIPHMVDAVPFWPDTPLFKGMGKWNGNSNTEKWADSQKSSLGLSKHRISFGLGFPARSVGIVEGRKERRLPKVL